MNPQDDAELNEKLKEIHELIVVIGKDLSFTRIQRVMAMIAAEIRSAVDEQRNRDHMPMGPCGKAISLAIKSAYLDAAKIADEHNGCVERVCLDRGLNCGITIAEQLRTKAEELG